MTRYNALVNLVVYPSGIAEWNKKNIRCALGFGGVSHKKREGDGVTPAGLFQLRRVFYRPDRIKAPRTILPVSTIGRKAGWCDNPKDPNYNKYVSSALEARHERLWRKERIYDLVGVVGYNDQPIIPNAGSAIFIHVARAEFSPTEGCVAFSKPALLQILEEWVPTSTVEIRAFDSEDF